MDIRSLGKDPISTENPAGEDVKYTPEFEALQSEIDKLSVVTSGSGGVDWNHVLKLSESVLAEKSKNLLVAAYMAEALMKIRGFEGFVQGSIVLKDLVENYWDTCFPPKKRKKGRLNAFQWWYERAGNFIAALDPLPLRQAMVDEVCESLRLLDQMLSEKIDDAPILRPLLQRIERLPVETPPESNAEPEAVPEANKAADTGASPLDDGGDANSSGEKPETAVAPDAGTEPDKAAASAAPRNSPETGETEPGKAAAKKSAPAPPAEKPDPPVGSQAFSTDKEANKALNGALETMARLSTYYLKQNTADSMGYRLNRLYAWLAIDSLPMIQADKKTPLPPPEAAIKESIEKQIGEGGYEEAIIAAESALRGHRFWLDLNRLCARSLESLGEPYAAACEIVCRQTAAFVKRLDGIETLKFSDGTPFADQETRSWLGSITASDGQTPPAGTAVSAPGDSGSSIYQDVETRAGELIRKKNSLEAVSLFHENLMRCGSGREKLMFRIGLCRILLQTGRVELALPHLETIESEIDRYHIEDWEPALAFQGLHLVYDGFRTCSRKECNQKAGAVFDRIARIDPASAYTL